MPESSLKGGFFRKSPNINREGQTRQDMQELCAAGAHGGDWLLVLPMSLVNTPEQTRHGLFAIRQNYFYIEFRVATNSVPQWQIPLSLPTFVIAWSFEVYLLLWAWMVLVSRGRLVLGSVCSVWPPGFWKCTSRLVVLFFGSVRCGHLGVACVPAAVVGLTSPYPLLSSVS